MMAEIYKKAARMIIWLGIASVPGGDQAIFTACERLESLGEPRNMPGLVM